MFDANYIIQLFYFFPENLEDLQREFKKSFDESGKKRTIEKHFMKLQQKTRKLLAETHTKNFFENNFNFTEPENLKNFEKETKKSFDGIPL